MEVSQQRGHLLLVESACESGHHAATLQDILPDGLVGGGDAAGEGRAVKQPVQVGWNLLESEVVVFMAVGAAHLVEMLPCLLLRCELGRRATADEERAQKCGKHSPHPPFRKKRERMGHPESAA